jgi:hypothetical protein
MSAKTDFLCRVVFKDNKMAAPDAETLQGLREAMRHYTGVDNELRNLNTRMYTLRREREVAKDNMVNIIQNPAFATIQRLQTADGAAAFKLVRPNESYKAWTLPQGTLRDYLIEFLGNEQGTRCYQQIVTRHRETLKITEYNIVRTD